MTFVRAETDRDGQTPKQPELTVGEMCDQRIEYARKVVEKLCVNKARLEALNMLHMPYKQLSEMLDVSPY